jgi:Protein of unknown function (DUF2927)
MLWPLQADHDRNCGQRAGRPGIGSCRRHHKCWIGACISVCVLIGIMSGDAAQAQNGDIALRRSLERTEFSNDEILQGFFKIAFGAELQFGRRVERIRKFDEPVRVLVINHGLPDRRVELAAVIAEVSAHVHHLDLMLTDDPKVANVIVTLVRSKDLNRTIRHIFGAGKAKQIARSLDPQCLSGFGKDQHYRIRRAEVILPVDAGEFTFLDCAYEELLQALGPINDDRSVPWTMFNDDVQMGFFSVYDQYLINLLYDPRIRPGMTKDQVRAIVPEILPSVRAWVASTNSPRESKSRNPLPVAGRTAMQLPDDRYADGIE